MGYVVLSPPTAPVSRPSVRETKASGNPKATGGEEEECSGSYAQAENILARDDVQAYLKAVNVSPGLIVHASN